jgi:hypothetical protein
VLGAPCGARPTHIVQFRPVWTNRITGQLTPESAKEVAEDHKWPGQHRDCRTGQGQDCSTHDVTPTPIRQEVVLLPFSRPVRRPGSRKAIMAPKRLKTGTRTAYRRHFFNQPFQRFTWIAHPLSACSFELPSLHQPRIPRQSVCWRLSVRWRIQAARFSRDQ